MTPGEHYAEAERLVAVADESSPQSAPIIALAQVHATLATAGPSPGDLTAAACRELRTLLEEFHAGKDALGHAVMVAGLTRADLIACLNRLAALERGEVPA